MDSAGDKRRILEK